MRVSENKVAIEYVFLIRTPTPGGDIKTFIDRYQQFARRIADPSRTRSTANARNACTRALYYLRRKGSSSLMIEVTTELGRSD